MPGAHYNISDTSGMRRHGAEDQRPGALSRRESGSSDMDP